MTRVEYGAQVISSGNNVYVHDFARAVVEAFIAEMGGVTPVRLVSRRWVGETHTGWELAA